MKLIFLDELGFEEEYTGGYFPVTNVNVLIESGVVTIQVLDLRSKCYLTVQDGNVVISSSLSVLINKYKFTHDVEAEKFYKKYGFILSPYTYYTGLFSVTAGKKIKIIGESVTSENVWPENKPGESVTEVLYEFFSRYEDKNLDILVSGGIDSSALLGFMNDKFSVGSCYMVKMSSLPGEGDLANSLCSKIGKPLHLVDLDRDLSSVAKNIISKTGELIYDPISVPLSALFDVVGNKAECTYLVDGQGADSLLNGLPANKLFVIRRKLGPLVKLLSIFSTIPMHKNKSSAFNRKIYRLSKALYCLSQPRFLDVFTTILTEDPEPALNNTLDSVLNSRISGIFEQCNDWHLTIRYFYLFEVLPVREMQKYSMCSESNVNVVTPFLDSEVISKLLYMKNGETIVSGIYKYPITLLAQKYWPGTFKNSSTSPFQVNYDLKGNNIKEFSLTEISNSR